MWLRDPAFRGDRRPPGGNQLYVTGLTDDEHGIDPARPDLHLLAGQGRQDAVEALLRQFRPAIVRYCRARLARTRIRTGSLDEDDVAQEVCLALLSALPSYRDMGRPFGAFVFAIAAHKVADAARGAARAPLPVPVLPDQPDRCLGPEETVLARRRRQARAGPAGSACPPRSGGCSCSGWWRGCPPRTPATCSTCRRVRSASPSTGPCSGSARSPPGRSPRPGRRARPTRPAAMGTATRTEVPGKRQMRGHSTVPPHLLSGGPMVGRAPHRMGVLRDSR